MKSLQFLVLHGPNLNLLGSREPRIYGTKGLPALNALLEAWASERGHRLRIRQSNLEGELVTAIQEARTWADGLVLNAGGYTHTSVAIRDALAASRVPAVEVHLSNPAAREPFRHLSLLAETVLGSISGFGPQSYLLGLAALETHLRRPASRR